MACEHGLDAAAYTLNSLSDDEAATFEAHLRDCEECRAEVEEQRVVVDTLLMASPPVVPPPQLRERIMRQVRSEAELLRAVDPDADLPPAPARGRRWGWRDLVARPVAAAGMACVLIAVGITTVVALQGDDPPASRTLAASVEAPGASASLRIVGTRATLRVRNLPGPPRGEVYQVWFVRDGGRPQPTRTLFDVRDGGRATVEIDESIDGVEQILVTAEPAGGSTVPTTAPIITAIPV